MIEFSIFSIIHNAQYLIQVYLVTKQFTVAHAPITATEQDSFTRILPEGFHALNHGDTAFPRLESISENMLRVGMGIAGNSRQSITDVRSQVQRC